MYISLKRLFFWRRFELNDLSLDFERQFIEHLNEWMS